MVFSKKPKKQTPLKHLILSSFYTTKIRYRHLITLLKLDKDNSYILIKSCTLKQKKKKRRRRRFSMWFDD